MDRAIVLAVLLGFCIGTVSAILLEHAFPQHTEGINVDVFVTSTPEGFTLHVRVTNMYSSPIVVKNILVDRMPAPSPGAGIECNCSQRTIEPGQAVVYTIHLASPPYHKGEVVEVTIETNATSRTVEVKI